MSRSARISVVAVAAVAMAGGLLAVGGSPIGTEIASAFGAALVSMALVAMAPLILVGDGFGGWAAVGLMGFLGASVVGAIWLVRLSRNPSKRCNGNT